MKMKVPWRCPHCHAKATPCNCVVCNRDMCSECSSLDERGNVCGLCHDRHAAVAKYNKAIERGDKLSFDEWYDKNG